MRTRVTDALDVAFDPKVFRKTRAGIRCDADKVCTFSSTNHGWIQAAIDRRSAEIVLPEITSPGRAAVKSWAANLRRGDVINFFVEPDRVNVHALYTTVYNVPDELIK